MTISIDLADAWAAPAPNPTSRADLEVGWRSPLANLAALVEAEWA